MFGFFALTFLVTWTCWVAASLIGGNPAGTARLFVIVLLYLGIFAPGIVALVLTARGSGRNAVRRLLGRLIDWRVAGRWYVFALGFMAAIKLGAALIHRVAMGAWPEFGTTPLVLLFGGAIVSTVTGGQMGEELGWRGFALPRLAVRLGMGGASVVLGIIWAAWHLPLFYILGGETVGKSFSIYLLQVTAISVVIGWLWWRTGASLLPVMLLHAAVNNTKDIVPSAAPGVSSPFVLDASPVGWLTLLLLWICAAYFLAQLRGAEVPAATRDPAGLRSGVFTPSASLAPRTTE